MSGPATVHKAKLYSGMHEPKLEDQLKAVLARCDSFEVQTNNKGQNPKATSGAMSPNFTLFQPASDYDKGVLSKGGYILVSGPDALGNKQEGFVKKSEVKSFYEWFRVPERNTGPASTTFLAQAAPTKSPQNAAQNNAGAPGVAGRRLDDLKSKLRSVGSMTPVTANAGKSGTSTEGAGDAELKKLIGDYTAYVSQPDQDSARTKTGSALRPTPSPVLTVAAEDLDSVSKPVQKIITIEFSHKGENVSLHLGGSTLDTGNLRSLFGRDIDARYWTPSNYKEVPPKGWLLVNESVLNGSDPRRSSGPSFIIKSEEVPQEHSATFKQCDRQMRAEIQNR